MNSETYLKIKKVDIPKDINCFEQDGKFYLNYGKARPICVKLPLILNENMAKIAAMIMDGCLGKDFGVVMFSQKKDLGKISEFAEICSANFGLCGKIHEINGCLMLTYASKTLTKFFHACLDIHKSDEYAKIPKWVWKSPKTVIVTYLRYAFAMEGLVYDYRKGNEVRFHSVDLPYLKELGKLLELKFCIHSKILTYHVKDYGYKHYLYFSDKENITKFLDIGFALETHQKRLEGVVQNFKFKAWEITIVKILELGASHFRIKDLNKKFNYLCKRAIYERLNSLAVRGYLLLDRKRGYRLTADGLKKAMALKSVVRFTRLRTNSKQNENLVLTYLKENKLGYRNGIARNLQVGTATIREVLNRLLKHDKIQMIETDKFQRKFYSIKSEAKVIPL